MERERLNTHVGSIAEARGHLEARWRTFPRDASVNDLVTLGLLLDRHLSFIEELLVHVLERPPVGVSDG